MHIIRQITREVTESKERMVPETYEETYTKDVFVMEISVHELNDMIRFFANFGHHASNDRKRSQIKAKQLREHRDAFMERKEMKNLGYELSNPDVSHVHQIIPLA
jgi:hypothetical protein